MDEILAKTGIDSKAASPSHGENSQVWAAPGVTWCGRSAPHLVQETFARAKTSSTPRLARPDELPDELHVALRFKWLEKVDKRQKLLTIETMALYLRAPMSTVVDVAWQGIQL